MKLSGQFGPVPLRNKELPHVASLECTGFNLSARIEGLITKFRAARARKAAFNRTYAELQEMTDRELVEFGLFRSDLADLARAHIQAA